MVLATPPTGRFLSLIKSSKLHGVQVGTNGTAQQWTEILLTDHPTIPSTTVTLGGRDLRLDLLKQ